MKNIFIATMTLFLSNIVIAQNSGTVLYEEKVKLRINIQGDAPPPPNLPTERKAPMILYFTAEVSLYRNDPNKETPEGGMIREEDSNGEHVQIRMSAPDNRTYCDLKNEKRIDQRDFLQRKFLIETDLKSSEWRITGNQKMILKYPCQEATRQDGDRKITAWFTTAIPVSTGPSSYCGLPGLVLEVNVNDGDHVIAATAVNLGEVDPSLIVKPKEGKKVTEEEFIKIREEKMKEMGAENGNGNNVIIKIENH